MLQGPLFLSHCKHISEVYLEPSSIHPVNIWDIIGSILKISYLDFPGQVYWRNP